MASICCSLTTRRPLPHRTTVLLGDPILRGRLAANARRLVEEKYDWQQVGQRFVDLVEATVQEKARQRG